MRGFVGVDRSHACEFGLDYSRREVALRSTLLGLSENSPSTQAPFSSQAFVDPMDLEEGM